MNNFDFIQSLDSLRQNLAESTKIDETVAEKMRLLVDEIQLTLTRSDSASHSGVTEPTLSDRLQEFIDDFQTHHPQLTSSLSLIAERLADMGI